MNNKLLFMETKIIGGWAGDQIDKAKEYAKEKTLDGMIAIIGSVGSCLLYASIIIVAFGMYCMIFNYRKPLKIGLFCFVVSLILIVIGGM